MMQLTQNVRLLDETSCSRQTRLAFCFQLLEVDNLADKLLLRLGVRGKINRRVGPLAKASLCKLVHVFETLVKSGSCFSISARSADLCFFELYVA